MKKSTLTNKCPHFVHGRLPDDLITEIFKVDIQGNNILSAFKKITDNDKSQILKKISLDCFSAVFNHIASRDSKSHVAN